MNAASNEFLARAGFTSNQDSLGVPRHTLDHGHEPLHRATGNDEFSAVDLALNDFALNRRPCFQCIPHRLPEYTSSASTLLPRLIPSRAKEKASTASLELIRNAGFRR